jgi:choline dehydrogenase-like flavoprotein
LGRPGLRRLELGSVLPYFKRSENNERGADAFHGSAGPLQVSNQKSPRPISSAFVEAATRYQYRRRDDFNDGDNEGFGLYQVTQFHDPKRNGERCPRRQPICIRSWPRGRT